MLKQHDLPGHLKLIELSSSVWLNGKVTRPIETVVSPEHKKYDL